MLVPGLIAFSVLSLALVGICALYLWLIALASLLPRRSKHSNHLNRFVIAIPAHNEQAVIGKTISSLKRLNYPVYLYGIFVVADNCTDQTARFCREQGVICYERQSATRSGKGAALSWLFEKIFSASCRAANCRGDIEADQNHCVDAIVIFDADTQVDENFLQVMNDRLEAGKQVVQGKHVISNPQSGWFPALTWTMMAIDCRFFSQGRSRLGFSARNMGDSICIKSDILKKLGACDGSLPSGLAEDYELRLRLLLQGICIDYESHAIGYGQAPQTWQEAGQQRLRWAKGVRQAGQTYRRKLLMQSVKCRDIRLLDGFLSSSLPSYSVLAMFSALMLLFCLFLTRLVTQLGYHWAAAWLVGGWVVVLFSLFLYPLFGLALEKAHPWAYLAILIGPLFMFWRGWIKLIAMLQAKNESWVRTPHRG